MAHRLDPAAPLASVHPAPSRIVVSRVNDRFVLCASHAFFAPAIFGHEFLVNEGHVGKKLWRACLVSTMWKIRTLGIALVSRDWEWRRADCFGELGRIWYAVFSERKSINTEKRCLPEECKNCNPW
jgi:hypothetical protein